MQLLRDQLLKKDALKVQKVDLGNDDFVYVTEMTARQKDIYDQSLLKRIRDKKGSITNIEPDTDDYRAKLLVITVCDENGNLILQPNDFRLLSQAMSTTKLDIIYKAAQEINGLSEEKQEEIEKNSDTEPEGNSSSDSVGN